MDAKVLLVKVITLLYRESQIKDNTENSRDLAKTVIESIPVPNQTMGSNMEVDVLRGLKETAMEMTGNSAEHEYDKISLLQRLKLNCSEDEKLYDALEQGIEPELDEKALHRTVTNIRKSINNYFKEKQIEHILNTAAYKFRIERDKITDVNKYVMEVISQLEPLQLSNTSKDPAVVNDIDIGDDKAMQTIFNDVKNHTDGKGIMKTGWKRVNTMLQGGFRRGEFVMIGALQHKYKTGFTLSLFQQIALFNTPYMIDPNKKPLLLRISFEDDLELNMQFMYQYLKYNETKEKIDIKNVATDEMANYVKDKLRVNGYHIKMMRVDPSQWTYRNICNKIVELEAQGYEIHLMMLDYLGLVPTTGCTIGPTGTDVQDMIRRIRNFCAPRKICCITPHQLSTEAKQLIRNGMPEDRFVKEVSSRGYFMGAKGLDRELDVELTLHIFKFKKETFLTLQLGKHRLPTIISEDDRYLLYRFPRGGMPIPHDYEDYDIGYSSLKEAVENNPDIGSDSSKDLFTF